MMGTGYFTTRQGTIRFCAVVALIVAGWAPLSVAQTPRTIRIATYNASLYAAKAGEVRQRLSDGKDAQAEKIAAIVQKVRPDVLLINEIDFDPQSVLARTLAEKFFAVAQGDAMPIEYPYVVAFASNTGIDSGLDLDNDGRRGQAQDAWGFGNYPGQYSFALFSRFPIRRDEIRTFQRFLWKDLPGALQPIDPKTNEPYYDEAAWAKLRLSSKNHVDVPLDVGQQTLHILASHPVPPVFDGGEDRNGCRNHDEIRFWSEYLRGESAGFLVDDQGRSGGLVSDQPFVILGDLNSDPREGDSRQAAISALLTDPQVNDPMPRSDGAWQQTQATSAQNPGDRRQRTGDGALHTASFGGNRSMRIDYVLPSRRLSLRSSGVFWPTKDDPDHGWIDASDHRLVWIEVDTPAARRQ
jgi:endonuclease/exonuclease/phosphatase family metal-dependent hydrolase